MCGIIGVVGKDKAESLLLEGLRRLEYRGYDSAGIATLVNEKIDKRRASGKISNLSKLLKEKPLFGSIGIAHTRWATHGAPNENNAHPHANDKVAIVHNGIIENYIEIREELILKGHKFNTETDSEVIVHLISNYIDEGMDHISAVKKSIKRLEGAFALGILLAGKEDVLIAARQDSPLAIGYGKDEMYLGSDALALAPLTDRIVYLENKDMAVISIDGIKIFDENMNIITREETKTLMSGKSVEKGGFKHYMLKEIHEQPTVIGETLKSFIDPHDRNIVFPEMNFNFKEIKKLTIIACGTSSYAAMVAKNWFEKYANIPTEVDIASEYRYRSHAKVEDEGVIVISQSGETADTLAALNNAKKRKLKTLAIINVIESSISRISDASVLTLAGPEIGVASTKAFTTQLATLACLVLFASDARKTMTNESIAKLVEDLLELPALTAEVLSIDKSLNKIAHQLKNVKDVLYVGRGISFPIALEGALKLKEISYIHAEAYAAGELKHGPIALVDEGVPVVALAPSDDLFSKTASNIEEVAARGAKIILISDKEGIKKLSNTADITLEIPNSNAFILPILYSIPVQMLAYHTAVAKGTDVDQPRNLAKSVTVE
ncbi:MAG: Glutamine--fructose-6-phosphate aminotransferase [isomerizing] [Alphaproteobacteria bacterium MarineAlpha9_Bin3]|nr:MAG: Glutamine--fructose-6-phosphate aminotransferase [isomerizing] [Alphaproteobacteria bacterium MarineAlpha9_Bin3]|tara:strand:+ start:3070 stop:4893 length:1824 start_codon:yes stop_codon:yes gene_type:complete